MTYNLTDICVNLAGKVFRNDTESVVDRAMNAGVSRMLVTASDIAESEACLQLARRFPDCIWSTAGVHPHQASSWDNTSTAIIKTLAETTKVVAIGECGLDYNRNFSPAKAQRAAFAAQLELAVELQLPVLLHERDASNDFISILREFKKQLPHAVVHCFTGNREALTCYLDEGLSIGITGWVCDERRGQMLAELVPEIPTQRLMLETDAPYLLPRNLRPKPKAGRNEPAFLGHICEFVAAIRNVPPTQLAEETTNNAISVFKFPTEK